MPPTDQLNVSSAYRLMHALWMSTRQAGSRILISGGGESARVMGEVAVIMGLPAERVTLDDTAVDTGDSAKHLRQRDSDASCVLVTSAGHMPRAMGVFKRQGIQCIPAPTEFYSTYPMGFFDYLPSPRNLVLSDLAVHEYLGIAWYRLRGRL